MRFPRWLGGGLGNNERSDKDDAFALKESEQEREQIWREKLEMDARIRSLREIAEFLGRMKPR